jgi:hypothetical protein
MRERYPSIRRIIIALQVVGMVIICAIAVFGFLSAVSGYRLEWFPLVQLAGAFLGVFLVVLSWLLEFLLEKYG